MIRLGLIGYPLGHSLSPKIHSAALKACGLEGDYSLFPTHPDDEQGLKELLDRVRTGEIHGLNVTIPHKQDIISLLDKLTPTAQAIGAVNTIYFHGDKLIGDNTDAPGFLFDLKRFFSGEHTEKNALVLGAGGSARAVVFALANDGWNITLTARRIEQAKELVKQFKNVHAIELNCQTLQHSNLQLIVNTTPIGMTPNTDQSPWPEILTFPPHAAIYDLIYNPRETKLMKDACAKGLPATTGLGMLIEQAALAFEIWTGHTPQRNVFIDSVVE